MIFLIFIFLFINIAYSYNIIFNIHTSGILTPYHLGKLGYIKHNIKIDKYELIGKSSGSWLAILYHFENNLSDHDKLWNILFGNVDCITYKNLYKLQNNAKKNLLIRYNNYNFNNIPPINIILEKYNNIFSNIIEYKNNFSNIDDLINICYASSYISLISGNKIYYKYYDNYFRDINFYNKEINISKIINNNDYIILDFNDTMISKDIYYEINKKKSKELFYNGWNNAEKNILNLINMYNK